MLYSVKCFALQSGKGLSRVSRDIEKSVFMGILLDLYGELLSERQREIADLYYNMDLSLSEVAENTGITRQGVRDSLMKSENMLLTFDKKLGLSAKYERIKTSLAQIISSLSGSDDEKVAAACAVMRKICAEL